MSSPPPTAQAACPAPTRNFPDRSFARTARLASTLELPGLSHVTCAQQETTVHRGAASAPGVMLGSLQARMVRSDAPSAHPAGSVEWDLPFAWIVAPAPAAFLGRRRADHAPWARHRPRPVKGSAFSVPRVGSRSMRPSYRATSARPASSRRKLARGFVSITRRASR